LGINHFIGAGDRNSIAIGNADGLTTGESVIVGGFYNKVAGSGIYAVIGGGTGNTNKAWSGTIADGHLNFIDGDDNYSVEVATIGGGSRNTVTASAATIPGGYGANASHWGESAYAAGYFGAVGDAQSSLYVARRTTTSATPTELFLDDSGARMTIPSGSTWIFEIQVAARSTNLSPNKSAGYTAKGVIDNIGGTTSFVAGSVTVLGEDDMNWDLQLEADDTNDALVLKGVGAASTTIRWVATIRTTEVSQ